MTISTHAQKKTAGGPIGRSENMRRIKSKDTGPEWIVRRAVWRLGFRYRVHRKDLPGRPDLAFGPMKKVIFVHGCFWHQHSPDCADSRMPKSNLKYWEPKLRRNQERDTHAIAALTTMGWRVLVIWECETTKAGLRERLQSFLTQQCTKSPSQAASPKCP